MSKFTEFPHFLMEDYLRSILADTVYKDIPLAIKPLILSDKIAMFTDWYFVTDYIESVVATITNVSSQTIYLDNKNISSIVIKNASGTVLKNDVHYVIDYDLMRSGSLYINPLNVQSFKKDESDPFVNNGDVVYITYNYMVQKDSGNGEITNETFVTIYDNTNNFQWNLFEITGSNVGRGFFGDGFHLVGAQKTIIGDGGKSFTVYTREDSGRYIAYKIYPNSTFDENRAMFFFDDIVLSSMELDPVEQDDLGLDGVSSQLINDKYAFVYDSFMGDAITPQKTIIIDQKIVISPNITVVYSVNNEFTPICPVEYMREDFNISIVDSLDRLYTSTISIVDGYIYEHDFIETDNFTFDLDVIDGFLCVKISRDARVTYSRIAYSLLPIIIPDDENNENVLSINTGSFTSLVCENISGNNLNDNKILLTQIDMDVYNRQDISIISLIDDYHVSVNASILFSGEDMYNVYSNYDEFDITVERYENIASIYITRNTDIIDYDITILFKTFKIVPDLVDIDILDGDLFQYESVLISPVTENVIDQFDMIQHKKTEYSVIAEVDVVLDFDWVGVKTSITDEQIYGLFGSSVSISGDGKVAVVGSNGSNVGGGSHRGDTHIYKWDGYMWNYTQTIIASDGEMYDDFGISVSSSYDGSVIVVGAYSNTINGNTYQGSSYVFRLNNGTMLWEEVQILTASDGTSFSDFGNNVSISSDGTTILVGSYSHNGNVGSSYVFRLNTNTMLWDETYILTASDGAIDDRFGNSVSSSVDGNILIIGSYGSSSNTGSVYIYKWNGVSWAETKLVAGDGVAGDKFGNSVSISNTGDIVLVGSYNSNITAGSAYIYKWNGVSWAETKLVAGVAGDYFGYSVSISGDGNSVIVGAIGNNTSGSIYIYTWDSIGLQWVMSENVSQDDGVAGDNFGNSVSVSVDGFTVISGAYSDNSNTGSVSIYKYIDMSHTLTYSCDIDIVSNGNDIFYTQDNVLGNTDLLDITMDKVLNIITVGYTSSQSISRIYVSKKYYNNIFFSMSVGEVSTQKQIVYGINSQITTNIDIFNGTEIYFRKDSNFHQWLREIASNYYLTSKNIDVVVEEYINIEKDFIYFGKIYKKYDGNIIITFEGIKDFVTKLLPVHMRTLGMKEFIYSFYDKEYSRIYDSLKNIWSIIDPKECDSYMLEKMIRYYGIDYIFESYGNKRFLSEYLIDILKSKGTYKSIHIIYNILSQNSKNVIDFYDSWFNFENTLISNDDLFYVNILDDTRPYYSKTKDSFVYNGVNVTQATRYSVDISIDTEPFDETSIMSKSFVKDMLWCFEEVRPVNRISKYNIVFTPEYTTSFIKTSHYDISSIVGDRDRLLFYFDSNSIVSVQSGFYVYEIVHNLDTTGIFSILYDVNGVIIDIVDENNIPQYQIDVVDDTTIRYTLFNDSITSVSMLKSSSIQTGSLDSIINTLNINIKNGDGYFVYSVMKEKYAIDEYTSIKQFVDNVSNNNLLYSYILSDGKIIDGGDLSNCPILTYENGVDMFISFDSTYSGSKFLNILMKKEAIYITQNSNYTYGEFPIIRSTYNGIFDYTGVVVRSSIGGITWIERDYTNVILSPSDGYIDSNYTTISIQSNSARMYSVYETTPDGDSYVQKLLNPSEYTLYFVNGEYVFTFTSQRHRVISYIDVGEILYTNIVPLYNTVISPEIYAKMYYNNGVSSINLYQKSSSIEYITDTVYENSVPYIYKYMEYIIEFSGTVNVPEGIIVNKFETIDSDQNVICYSDIYSELFIDYNMNIKYNINIV